MTEPPFGHEHSGIAVGRILAVGAILAGGVIVTVAAVCITLKVGPVPTPERSAAPAMVIPPAPRLETHPSDDLAAFRREQRASLESWRWTDRSVQFAQIPIERAMALYARQKHGMSGPTP